MVKSVCLAKACNLLETCTQSNAKLCEPLVIFICISCPLCTKKNMTNIMNCIVLVQALPGSPLDCLLDTIG